jgi:CRISPR-associated protein Cmr4
MTPNRHLLTLYTRTPLHVGSGSSVDVVDLPIMRERITGFPVIPASSLKGVLLQRAREVFDDGTHARQQTKPEAARMLFGDFEEEIASGEKKQNSWAGCVQIMEAKILAFPVRSLAGCFAWLTCPSVLRRFQRDTGRLVKTENGTSQPLAIPEPAVDHVIAGAALHIKGQSIVVFEEYALERIEAAAALADLATALSGLCTDEIWTGPLKPDGTPAQTGGIFQRLALVSDENFQHFVTTCTEVVTRIALDPTTRTVKDGHLFNQENVPSETLFYSVLTVFPAHTAQGGDPATALATLLPDQPPLLLQIGGDETTGHGLCECRRTDLAGASGVS